MSSDPDCQDVDTSQCTDDPGNDFWIASRTIWFHDSMIDTSHETSPTYLSILIEEDEDFNQCLHIQEHSRICSRIKLICRSEPFSIKTILTSNSILAEKNPASP